MGEGYFTYFSALEAVEDLRRGAHGSVFDTITRASFDSVHVPVPTADDVASFERAAGPLLELSRGLQQEMAELASTRDELLPVLMSGAVQVAGVGA
jgi:type I restriction enzyme S subunit